MQIDSVGLRWGRESCIPKELPGDANTTGPRTAVKELTSQLPALRELTFEAAGRGGGASGQEEIQVTLHRDYFSDWI